MKTAVVLALVLPRLALADVPDDGVNPGDGSAAPAAPAAAPASGTPFHHKDIVVVTPGERSSQNIAILATVAGVGVILGGIGAYYNLDSKSASDEVSAHRPMSVPWTPERQATYDRAHDSASKAELFYGLGAAALVGAGIALIVTQPKTETTVIHPHVAVGPTGAVIGGAWSF